MRVLREAPAPSDKQTNQVGAFSGQLAALQCAFGDYKESAFSADKDSTRSTKKASKKKKKMTRADADAVGQQEQDQQTPQPIMWTQQVDRSTGEKQMQTLQGGSILCGQA